MIVYLETETGKIVQPNTTRFNWRILQIVDVIAPQTRLFMSYNWA